jgi:hypothetical protein
VGVLHQPAGRARRARADRHRAPGETVALLLLSGLTEHATSGARFFRSIGGAFGVAICGSIYFNRLLDGGSPEQHADVADMLDRLSRALVGEDADRRALAR